jgi:hypothetical protein
LHERHRASSFDRQLRRERAIVVYRIRPCRILKRKESTAMKAITPLSKLKKCVLAFGLATFVAPMFLAEAICAAESAAPAPSAGTPSVLPRPDFHFPGNVGRTYADSEPAQFPQPVQAPKGAPNVVLILLDDVGFGQFSTFGGGVPSPTMDRLAAEGLRYNRFHTTALCSPSRAALITGRNHHSAAFAGITEVATGYDGYTCILPRNCGTVAEVLRQNGYMTAWIGKNHNTPTWELSAAGPFDRWANGLGFDYFYGFNGGDMNQFQPVLYENHNLVPAPTYHLSSDIADHAIAWMRNVKSIAPDRPFFLYVAPAATHAPHQAPADWIAKFKGKFDLGWDKYREETIERQKKLGVIPPNTKLTARSAGQEQHMGSLLERLAVPVHLPNGKTGDRSPEPPAGSARYRLVCALRLRRQGNQPGRMGRQRRYRRARHDPLARQRYLWHRLLLQPYPDNQALQCGGVGKLGSGI